MLVRERDGEEDTERRVEDDRECGEARESFCGVEACLYRYVFLPPNHEGERSHIFHSAFDLKIHLFISLVLTLTSLNCRQVASSVSL